MIEGLCFMEILILYVIQWRSIRIIQVSFLLSVAIHQLLVILILKYIY